MSGFIINSVKLNSNLLKQIDMSATFRFTSGGKDYTNDIKGGIQSMFKEAMTNKLNSSLGHLIDEIHKEKGNISIDVDNGKVSFQNCSEQLIEKIKTAINN